MSIKPVDYQVMLPKTAEVSKLNSDEQHKNMVIQQQQASLTQLKAETSLRQVHSQDKAQEARIKEKQEKNQGGRKDERKKNKQGNRQVKDSNTSTIDIRL